MIRKSGPAEVQFKAGPAGLAVATFSRFNVVDSDNDITLPGAIPDGIEVPVSAYGHKSWAGALPVGRAVIHSDTERAWAECQFFLGSAAARDCFEVVKELGELGQWSFGYTPIVAERGKSADGQPVQFLKKLQIHEVSPVLVGAGVDVHTESAKSIAQREYARYLQLIKPPADDADDRELAALEYLKFIRDRVTH